MTLRVLSMPPDVAALPWGTELRRVEDNLVLITLAYDPRLQLAIVEDGTDPGRLHGCLREFARTNRLTAKRWLNGWCETMSLYWPRRLDARKHDFHTDSQLNIAEWFDDC